MMFPAAPAASRYRLCLLALCAALAACGTPASGTGASGSTDVLDSVKDLISHDGDKTDAPSKDLTTGDGSTDDTQDVADQISSDVPPDGAQQGCEFPAKPVAGEPGSPCKANDECDSNACVDGPEGKICTQSCSSCCPTGFKCDTFTTGGGDSFLACIPKWNALCRPCETDAECAKLGKDALCVQYKNEGGFCGGPCQADSDCPSDYKCQDAQGEKGAAKQCVRTTGACSCSPQAISDGAQTTCKITNDVGTCSGVRKCTLAGLDPCPAATPAPETCGNNIDDDCNGKTDENGAQGCTELWSDNDGDGDGQAGSVSKCQCAPSDLYTATTATDCNDFNKAINGKAIEVCDDIDNNCDGKTDEGCDDDGDGWCDANMVVIGDPLVCKKGKKDCDDTNAAIHPGQQELCGNGIDDDCDGLTDSGPNVSGCVPFYADNDSDGYGAGDPVCQCAAQGIYGATKTGDCADNDPNINPGAKEVCGNQKDDDCNGSTDEAGAQGCFNYYVDLDSDGFGTATPTCLCGPDASHTAVKGGDCNDSAVGINPAATETCNGVDDNCNGTTDEMDAAGCTVFYLDADGDTFGNPGTGLCLCNKTALSSTAIGGDCNDDSAAAHPGATEICDGLDNDCDGLTDEVDAQGCSVFFADNDNDGWGDATKSACLCAANTDFKTGKLGDCDDGNAAINPAAKEVCDGIDNNCKDGTDEAGAQGCTTFWRDHDGDKYGDTADSQCLCGATGEYAATKSGDCDDNNKNVNPKAAEVCDGLDNDCDGVTDPANSDGCTYLYVDKDGDGYGTFAAATKCLCGAATGYASVGGDCNDGDPTVHPNALEICNGKDDDCDGVKDPKNTSGCALYYVDLDSDTYGQDGLSQCQCAPDGAFSALQKGDCNDTNPLINPGMNEACNGVDDNCNGQTDEGVSALYYTDGDKDGYGTGIGVKQCAASGAYTATSNGDCDDTNAAINPGATEVCNGIDDNCAGGVDEGLPTQTYYKDGDLDGYGGVASATQCGPFGGFTVLLSGDCNDAVASINPGAAEVCNSLDDNCNSQTDEGLPTQTYYQDNDGDGYGNAAVTQVYCAKPAGYATLSTDCDDTKAGVNPGATEICGNGIDDNCVGGIDEGCNTCTPTPLIDFENQDVSAWTLGTDWALYGPPGYKGQYSLEFTDYPNSHGYSPGINGTASTTVSVPAGTTTITISVDYKPYMANSCFLIFCSDGTDTKTTVTLTALGVSKTIAAATAPGVYDLSVTLPVVPTKQTDIPINISVANTDNNILHSYSSKGYVAVDNIRTTCP